MFRSFSCGERFMFNEQQYEIRKTMDLDVEVQNLTYNRVEVFSRWELAEAYARDKLVFAETEAEKASSIKHDYEQQYTKEEKLEMELRYLAIEPFVTKQKRPNELKTYLENYPPNLRPPSTPKLSAATFYRWKKLWDTHQDIRALAPQYDKRGSTILELSIKVQFENTLIQA